MKAALCGVLSGVLWLFLMTMGSRAAELDRDVARSSINALRADRGVPGLSYSLQLEAAARAHAEDMAQAGFFSHTGSDGSNLGERVRNTGYRWCNVAENIAKGQRDLKQVMQSWQASRGHRKNMLNRKMTEFALYQAPGHIWVMVLARPGC